MYTRFSSSAWYLALLIFMAVFSVAGAGADNVPGTSLNATAPVQGHQVWNYTTGGWIASSPAAAGGLVWIGSEDGNIYAFDAVSGNASWKYPSGSSVSSSPKISGTNLYIGSGDKTLYALDAGTGAAVWKYRASASISSAPAVSDGTVYTASDDGNIYALDAASGTLLWKYATGSYLHSSPAVSGGIVYVGSYNHNLAALNASSGTPVWNFTTGSPVISSPAVADGRVYFGSDDRAVYALDAGAGTLAWKFVTGGSVRSSPVISGGTVYIGSGDGNLYALDAASGTERWAYKTGGAVDSAPIVDNKTICFGSSDGNLSVLDAATGQPIWYYPVKSPIVSTPAVDDGIVYLGSYDHTVYALSNQPPVADFSADTTSGKTPVIVHFTDLSARSPTSWHWDFGDGETSTEQNPAHTYTTEGNFTISLTAANGGGSDSRARQDYVNTITILPPAPVANFTTDRLIGKAPFTVHFADASQGVATAWQWDFGDGNTSERANPVYTYVTPGNYTVTMTAKNRGGSSSMTQKTPIVVLPDRNLPAPDFTADNLTGIAPLSVRFTDDTENPGTFGYSWDFNADGIPDSTDKDPVCVYKIPGNYTVNLTISNGYGSRSVSKAGFITVTNGMTADFTADNLTGIAPLAVRFKDTSSESAGTTWAWDFNGDGVIDSTEQDPTCVYRLPGNYTVNLTITSSLGTVTASKPGFILIANRTPVPDFTADNLTGVAPLTVRFSDNSTGEDIAGYSWDFNTDGIPDSTDKDPVCVYKIPGNYTVNLTVSNRYGSRTLSKPGFILVTNGVTANFTADNLTGIAPLSVRFKDTSSGSPGTAWAWDFNGDGVIDSTEQDPTCVYKLPGNYTVNLSVTNSLGTVTASKPGFILVTNRTPVPDFTADNLTGVAPLAVRFSDASSGDDITSWAWDFNGDGVVDSTDKNATCVYNVPGNYTVRLTVDSKYGTNTTEKTGYILVTSGVPRARFSVNKIAGNAPLTVQFKDTSIGTNITGRAWDFNGDGVIDNTEQNPSCTYNFPGNYTISLMVSNEYGSNTTVRKGFVRVT